MAVAFQSASTKAWAEQDPITLDKPSGTVDGDLLIAIIGIGEGSLTVDSVPSGWTLIKTDAGTNANRLYSYWKVAASEGASWDWGLSGSDDCAGVVLRFDGQSLLTPVYASNGDSESNDDTPVFTDTITPTVANSLLIFPVLSVQNGSSTHSDYAITTSNPTWTERAEVGPTLGFTLSVATATRPEVTATGDSTVTMSGGAGTSDSIGQLIAVAPRVDVTTNPAVVTLTATIVAPTVTGGGTVSPAVVTMTATINAPTATGSAPTWVNQSKNASSWTNQAKS